MLTHLFFLHLFVAFASAFFQPASADEWPNGGPAVTPIPYSNQQYEISVPTDVSAPVIEVWYSGDQTFNAGNPQVWINLLGTASDPESSVQSLVYFLNGSGPRYLNLGPDQRRLADPGDFNADISIYDGALINGANTVLLRATNGANLTAETTIRFSYTAGKVWPLPYSVNWQNVTRLQSAAQVVDGKWQVTASGVRAVQVAYDRVLALGDITWTDYEVLVPFTINQVDSSAYNRPISINPGLGVNLRWTGHTNSPVYCAQPQCGWEPTGASVWYEFFANAYQNNLSLQASPPYTSVSSSIQFTPGVRYWIRARVETNSSGTLYRASAWQDGSPEPGWMLVKQVDPSGPGRGSLLLVAHHVDVTFGNISVIPVNQAPPPTPTPTAAPTFTATPVPTAVPTSTPTATPVPPAPQYITITTHAPLSAVPGSQFRVSASASSGLPVSYASGSPAACSYSGGGVFIITAASGSCVVIYSQEGSASFQPAPQQYETVTIRVQTAVLQRVYLPLMRQ